MLFLIIFSFVYTAAFFLSLKRMFEGRQDAVFLFIIWGLPIYTTTLSLIYYQNYQEVIPVLQSFKEINILTCLFVVILQTKTPPKLLILDWLVISFMAIAITYTILPLGSFTFKEKIIALKSIAFFPVIYFTGRLISLEKIEVSKLLTMIGMLTIVTAGISLAEKITNTHFQSLIGYAEFNEGWYGQEISGNYGLSWTFEIENGKKRFASLFSNPLEHASATILALSTIAALYTENQNKLNIKPLGWISILATLVCIFLALSRASFISYFGVLFLYGIITKSKEIVYVFYTGIIAFGVYLIFFTEKEILEFAINTFTFSNESSIGHLTEWITGIEAIMNNPLGLGLGSSGRISALKGVNIGGENQFIIIGVQLGIAGLALYLTIYIVTIVQTIRYYPFLQGKEQKITLLLLLVKAGLLIPLFTSNLESYIYVSYMVWMISGIFSQIMEKHIKEFEL